MARFVTQAVRTTIKSLVKAESSKSFLNCVGPARSSVFNVRSISTTNPAGAAERWYTEKHEWVQIDGKIGTVGISDYAQDALGDVVFAQLPDVGSTIKKDEECGALESVKAASEVISPVTGKIVETNESVEKKPGLINTSCYENGWLFKVELVNPDEIETLMDEKSYTEYLKSDPH